MFEWVVLVFDIAPMFTFVKRGHCDIVWYVERYKGLVLNSICKINSLRQERWEDSYMFLPASFSWVRFLFFLTLSACSFLNSPFQLDIFFLPAPFSSKTHTTSLCSPLHVCLKSISVLRGHFVEVNVEACGPAGGHCRQGIGSLWDVTGHGWWAVLAPTSVNVCVYMRVLTGLPIRNLPWLPLCHFSVILFLLLQDSRLCRSLVFQKTSNPFKFSSYY